MCVVAERVSSEGGQGTTTRNAEVQGQPGLVKIREGREPSNKATTRVKYDKTQTLGHSLTSAGTGEGLPKASSDQTRISETEVHSSVRLLPFPVLALKPNKHTPQNHASQWPGTLAIYVTSYEHGRLCQFHHLTSFYHTPVL